MSNDTDAGPTAAEDAPSPESIDAFLNREFNTALAAELARGNCPEEVQKSLVEVAGSVAPDKKAWLEAVDPPPKVVANG